MRLRCGDDDGGSLVVLCAQKRILVGTCWKLNNMDMSMNDYD